MLQSNEQIGRLDKRITFQEQIIGVNASNEDEENGWQNISDTPTVWAKVEERSGSELYRAEKLTDLTVAVFTIRYRIGISTKNRIIYNNKKWDIQAILNGSRKGYLSITAESGGEYQET
jgi:SPP1 family predicted phage head-tail adaptor